MCKWFICLEARFSTSIRGVGVTSPLTSQFRKSQGHSISIKCSYPQVNNGAVATDGLITSSSVMTSKVSNAQCALRQALQTAAIESMPFRVKDWSLLFTDSCSLCLARFEINMLNQFKFIAGHMKFSIN